MVPETNPLVSLGTEFVKFDQAVENEGFSYLKIVVGC